MPQLTFWLQIPVNETHQVQVLQRRRHLGRVEPGVFLGYALPRPRLQRTEELPATAVFHAEVEIVLGLERVVERDDEWVIARRQNLLLRQRPLDLVPLDHLL